MSMARFCKIYCMFKCVGKESTHKAVHKMMNGEIHTTTTVYEYRSIKRCQKYMVLHNYTFVLKCEKRVFLPNVRNAY